MPVPRTPIRRRRTIAIASSLALVVGACGGGADNSVETIAVAEDAATDDAAAPTTDDTAPEGTAPAAEPPEAGVPSTEPDDAAASEEPTAEPEPEEPAGPNDLPAVVVRDVATGDEVDLSSFAPGELPFVVWFYAPH